MYDRIPVSRFEIRKHGLNLVKSSGVKSYLEQGSTPSRKFIWKAMYSFFLASFNNLLRYGRHINVLG